MKSSSRSLGLELRQITDDFVQHRRTAVALAMPVKAGGTGRDTPAARLHAMQPARGQRR